MADQEKNLDQILDEKIREMAESGEGYHSFLDHEGREHGSFELFHLEAEDITELKADFLFQTLGDEERDSNTMEEAIENGDFPYIGPGWYWAAGFPGCLHDGEPTGPFSTALEAIEDALYL